ncbi:MAG: GTPase [Atribacterota bacterium]|jgi:GTPase SAR1 family protein|nr:GTPase [Atribacterota bacterium]
MKKFEFVEKSSQFKEISTRLMQLKKEPLLEKELGNIEHKLQEKDAESRLKIAICGQYSAGKSTLVYALTNDDSVTIGQDITTSEVKAYPWNDLLIVDTPGIHAGRPDHDEISKEYIEQADLLIYMLTIQGFTREIGANFKSLIMEKYLPKTMLLMNKRNQEPAENEANWHRDTVNFLGDAELLDKLYFSIVDIEDYLLGMKENIPELIEESNFPEFVSHLNQFAEDKGLLGKLLSRVNILEAFLMLSIEQYSKSHVQDEFTRRQKRIVSKTLAEIKKCISTERMRIRQDIRQLGNRLSGLLTDETIKEFNQAVSDSELELEKILDTSDLESNLEQIVQDLGSEMQDIEDAAESYEQNLRELIKKRGIAEVDDVIDLSMFKKGSMEVGKLASSATREGVTKVMHFFGHKFKPWGATKLTKFIKGVGAWLAGIGVVIDTVSFFQDKKHQEELQSKRTSIREDFSSIEEGVNEQFAAMENEEGSIIYKLKKVLLDLEKREREQLELVEKKKELARQMQEIKNDLDQLKLSIT